MLLQDLDGQFVNHHPLDPRLHRDLPEAVALLAPTGLDPYVGRRLWGLLRQAGLCGGGLEIEQYEAVAGSVRPEVRAQWEASLESAAELLGTLRFEDAHGLAERMLAYLDATTRSRFHSCSRRGRARPELERPPPGLFPFAGPTRDSGARWGRAAALRKRQPAVHRYRGLDRAPASRSAQTDSARC